MALVRRTSLVVRCGDGYVRIAQNAQIAQHLLEAVGVAANMREGRWFDEQRDPERFLMTEDSPTQGLRSARQCLATSPQPGC